MRSPLLIAALALLGFTARAVDRAEREIRITTHGEHGVAVEDLTGQGRTVELAGPHVSIPLQEATFRIINLDGPGVSWRWESEKEWVTFEGSFEVEIRQDDDLKARLRISDATMVVGEFEGSEGWTR